MGPKYFGARRSFLAVPWAFALGAALIVSGCGPLGGDDEPDEPPVTVEATRGAELGTPEASRDGGQVATPEFDGIIIDDAATPESDSDDVNQADRSAGPENVASPISESTSRRRDIRRYPGSQQQGRIFRG